VAAVLAGCSSRSGPADGVATSAVPASITVTSPSFGDGGAIPEQFTCRGAGTSPPLAWSGLPPATRSVAVLVQDPDAPRGTFVHWILFGLPPGQHDLPAGTVPVGAVQARNSRGAVGWTPPCPPGGTHHYRFTVYALGSPVDLPDGAATEDAVRAVRDASIAQGVLTGTVTAGG
jgi:Raf kinase inhibitor-like YbhB/YbcL family protein